MEYTIKAPRICGDVVGLCLVAEAMAKAKAKAFGATEFHRPTYNGAFQRISASLVNEAKKGTLRVCDSMGITASADELFNRAKDEDSFCTQLRPVGDPDAVEPDWKALRAKRPESEAGVVDMTPRKTVRKPVKLMVDQVMCELLCLNVTLKHLNDWGASDGNSFSLDPNAPPWNDERGEMGLPEKSASSGAGTKTKSVGGRKPVSRNAAEEAKKKAQELIVTFQNKGHWTALRIMAREDFVLAVFGTGAKPFTVKELGEVKDRNTEFLKRYGVGFRAIKDAVNSGIKAGTSAGQPAQN